MVSLTHAPPQFKPQPPGPSKSSHLNLLPPHTHRPLATSFCKAKCCLQEDSDTHHVHQASGSRVINPALEGQERGEDSFELLSQTCLSLQHDLARPDHTLLCTLRLTTRAPRLPAFLQPPRR